MVHDTLTLFLIKLQGDVRVTTGTHALPLQTLLLVYRRSLHNVVKNNLFLYKLCIFSVYLSCVMYREEKNGGMEIHFNMFRDVRTVGG